MSFDNNFYLNLENLPSDDSLPLPRIEMTGRGFLYFDETGRICAPTNEVLKNRFGAKGVNTESLPNLSQVTGGLGNKIF